MQSDDRGWGSPEDRAVLLGQRSEDARAVLGQQVEVPDERQRHGPRHVPHLPVRLVQVHHHHESHGHGQEAEAGRTQNRAHLHLLDSLCFVSQLLAAYPSFALARFHLAVSGFIYKEMPKESAGQQSLALTHRCKSCR